MALSFQKSIALYRRAKRNPQFKEIGAHALGLNYALITFAVTGLFVHAAYTALLPVLAGLTVSLLRTTEPLLARQAPLATPLVRAPSRARGYLPSVSRLARAVTTRSVSVPEK